MGNKNKQARKPINETENRAFSVVSCMYFHALKETFCGHLSGVFGRSVGGLYKKIKNNNNNDDDDDNNKNGEFRETNDRQKCTSTFPSST